MKKICFTIWGHTILFPITIYKTINSDNGFSLVQYYPY